MRHLSLSTIILLGFIASGCSEQNFSSKSSTLSAKTEANGTVSQDQVLVDDTPTDIDAVDAEGDHSCSPRDEQELVCIGNGEKVPADSPEALAKRSSLSSGTSVSGRRDKVSSDKVKVCHVPPGNPEARHEICISRNALPAHLGEHNDNHSDYLGSCDGNDDDQDNDEDPQPEPTPEPEPVPDL